MSNLLAIPSKKTYQIEVKDPVRRHISQHAGGHPDDFRDDIRIWQDLRSQATASQVHVNRIDALILYVKQLIPVWFDPIDTLRPTRYHAQLVSVLAKLPSDVRAIGALYGHEIHPC
jgi:programmed cell death 6-interacting protein